MITPIQILLIVVVVTLTVILSVIGIQVFFILKEFRESMKKTNKILDDAGEISESISKPISALSNSIVGFSGITGLLGWLRNRKKGDKTDE